MVLQPSMGADLSSSPAIMTVGHLIFEYLGGEACTMTLQREIYPSGVCPRTSSRINARARGVAFDPVALVGIESAKGSTPSNISQYFDEYLS